VAANPKSQRKRTRRSVPKKFRRIQERNQRFWDRLERQQAEWAKKNAGTATIRKMTAEERKRLIQIATSKVRMA